MHKFIRQMMLRNTVNAALQRACIYRNETDLELKREFKTKAKKWLSDFGEGYQRSTMNPKSWCDGMGSLSKILAEEFGPYLRDGKIRLGICQKMVSLYLKYLWLTANNHEKKPLFAVIDRGVMRAAGVLNAPNWTLLDDEVEYLRIVKAIDEHAQRNGHVDGAHWEAEEWVAIGDDEQLY